MCKDEEVFGGLDIVAHRTFGRVSLFLDHGFLGPMYQELVDTPDYGAETLGIKCDEVRLVRSVFVPIHSSYEAPYPVPPLLGSDEKTCCTSQRRTSRLPADL